MASTELYVTKVNILEDVDFGRTSVKVAKMMPSFCITLNSLCATDL